MGFKRGDGPDKIESRIKEIADWIRENYPEIHVEQRHTEPNSQERGYYMYGYMMALVDMIQVLKRLGIKWRLD